MPTQTPMTVADLLWWIVLVGGGAIMGLVTFMARKILDDKESAIVELKAKVEKLEGLVLKCEDKHDETDKKLRDALIEKSDFVHEIKSLKSQIEFLQRKLPGGQQ